MFGPAPVASAAAPHRRLAALPDDDVAFDTSDAPDDATSRTEAPAARILIVDDNPSIHEDFRKILCPPDPIGFDDLEALLFDDVETKAPRPKFDLAYASQGQEALGLVEAAVAEGRPFALAFVDVRMPPGWDGVETSRRFWQVDPNLQVVICTAYSDHSWDEVALKLGVDSPYLILKKPFDNAEVRQMAHALSRPQRQESAHLTDIRRAIRDLEPLVFGAATALGRATPIGAGLERAYRTLVAALGDRAPERS
jgi:CheY-like chemotaxis protein